MKVALDLKGIDKWNDESRLIKNETEQLVDADVETLDLSGTDDLRIVSVPKLINKLTNLRELNLSSNKIRELPSIMGELSALETLALDCNRLQEIPEWIGHFPALKSLTASKNALSGDGIPSSFGLLASTLTTLNLSLNGIERIQPAFQQLTALRVLNLSGNQHLREGLVALIHLTNLQELAIFGCPLLCDEASLLTPSSAVVRSGIQGLLESAKPRGPRPPAAAASRKGGGKAKGPAGGAPAVRSSNPASAAAADAAKVRPLAVSRAAPAGLPNRLAASAAAARQPDSAAAAAAWRAWWVRRLRVVAAVVAAAAAAAAAAPSSLPARAVLAAAAALFALLRAAVRSPMVFAALALVAARLLASRRSGSASRRRP
jgi:hypothetical protein